VGPLGVVLLSPGGRERPGIPDAIEDLHGEELVSKAAVGALGVAVLPRAPGLNVEGADAYGSKPAP